MKACGVRKRICRPVTWEQYDGTTVYKCKNVGDSVVVFGIERFVYCPICGGRIEVDNGRTENSAKAL